MTIPSPFDVAYWVLAVAYTLAVFCALTVGLIVLLPLMAGWHLLKGAAAELRGGGPSPDR